MFDPAGRRRDPALADALSEFIERGRLNTTRFGNYLRKHTGRIINGQTVVQARKNRLNTVSGKSRTQRSHEMKVASQRAEKKDDRR